MTIVLFVAALVLGVLTSRVGVIAGRGVPIPQSLLRIFLGGTAVIATFSLFVWGFAALSWYWPIIAFASGTVIAAVLVSRSSWPGFYLLQPLLEVVVIAISLYLWIWNFPFH